MGRLGSTVDTVEQATAAALRRRRERPRLGGSLARGEPHGLPVYPDEIGYVKRIDMGRLQFLAERFKRHITVASLPGTFATPDRSLDHIGDLYDGGGDEVDTSAAKSAFLIGQGATSPDGRSLEDSRRLSFQPYRTDGL